MFVTLDSAGSLYANLIKDVTFKVIANGRILLGKNVSHF